MTKFKWIKPTVKWGLPIILTFGLGLVLYAEEHKTVTISLNGEGRTIATFASTVQELLEEERIQVARHDTVSFSLEEKLTEGMEIVYKKAFHMTLTTDGVTEKTWSTAKTVEEALQQQAVQLQPNDYVSIPMNSEINRNVDIIIETAKQVVVTDGLNAPQIIWTIEDTLTAFLDEIDLPITGDDYILSDGDILREGQNIQVIRVTTKENAVDSVIPFLSEHKEDSTLLKGKKQVVQKGKNGKEKHVYAVTYENEQEVKRTIVSEKVIEVPTKEIIAIGTKQMVASVSRGEKKKEVEESGNEFYVTATAYTANCTGCSGITATGINLQTSPSVKVIAVDPSLIPLGTKVWVEGYGYAIAGDKGTAIKGNKIDVFISDKDDAYKWGRKKVKIRIL